MFVLDASLALTWHFEDESSDASEQAFVRALEEGVAVPEHWFLEIANGVAKGERRARSTPAASVGFLDQLGMLDKLVDPIDAGAVLTTWLSLARVHRISIYDAGYLELAERRGLPLATFDVPLARAARSVSIEVIGAAEE